MKDHWCLLIDPPDVEEDWTDEELERYESDEAEALENYEPQETIEWVF